MKKQVIWDLFGGGCNSITHMLIKENLINKYDVYTFDVVPLIDGQINNKNHHYLYCDLSVGVNKTSIYEIKMIRSGVEKKITLKNVSSIIDLFNGMIKKKIIKSPDIITSSTLCQSFSSILSMKNGGTCFWVKDNKNMLRERERESNFLN